MDNHRTEQKREQRQRLRCLLLLSRLPCWNLSPAKPCTIAGSGSLPRSSLIDGASPGPTSRPWARASDAGDGPALWVHRLREAVAQRAKIRPRRRRQGRRHGAAFDAGSTRGAAMRSCWSSGCGLRPAGWSAGTCRNQLVAEVGEVHPGGSLLEVSHDGPAFFVRLRPLRKPRRVDGVIHLLRRLDQDAQRPRTGDGAPQGRDIVIEAETTRDQIHDGWPYSNADGAHGGYQLRSVHGPMRYECGTFNHWQDNLRSIRLTLAALGQWIGTEPPRRRSSTMDSRRCRPVGC